jgi:hypothetical protein
MGEAACILPPTAVLANPSRPAFAVEDNFSEGGVFVGIALEAVPRLNEDYGSWLIHGLDVSLILSGVCEIPGLQGAISRLQKMSRTTADRNYCTTLTSKE